MKEMISSRSATSLGAQNVDFDNFDDMYRPPNGPNAGKPFGTELHALCELYKNKSPLSSSPNLTYLLNSLLRDSSVQAVLPFEAIIIIEQILDGLDNVCEFPSRLTKHHRFRLSQCVGNAGLVPLLIEVAESISKDVQSDSSSVDHSPNWTQWISDCKVVLAFVKYLSDNVKLSFEPGIRFRLLAKLRSDPRGKPPSAKAYTSSEHISLTSTDSVQIASSGDDLYDIDGFFRKGSHYPCWYVGCERGVYKKDSDKKDSQDAARKQESESSGADGGCAKDFPAGRGRTGGLFTFVCPHGVCYGFHIIPRGEGRNDVFTTIKTRFKIAPHIIVYDFACQLMEYCLNRDPEFFAFTRFFIDRFHESNHTSCSPAHFLRHYAQLGWLNSQVNEQLNSKLKTALSRKENYNYPNFMHSARLAIRVINQEKNNKTRMYCQIAQSLPTTLGLLEQERRQSRAEDSTDDNA